MEWGKGTIKEWLWDKALFEKNCSSVIQDTLWKDIFKNRDILKINKIKRVDQTKQTVGSLFDILIECSAYRSLIEDILLKWDKVAQVLVNEEKKRNEEFLIANKFQREQEAEKKLYDISKILEEIYKNKFLDIMFWNESIKQVGEDDFNDLENSIENLGNEYKAELIQKYIESWYYDEDKPLESVVDKLRETVLKVAGLYIWVREIDKKTVEIKRLSLPGQVSE